MEHNRLLNTIMRRSQSQGNQAAQTRAGKIASVSPDGASAKVTILPEGVLTGWLPVGFIAVGDNSIVTPPNVGDLVELTALEGDAENWMISSRMFTTASPAPVSPATSNPIRSGELGIIMKCGSYLHFENTGTVYAKANARWVMQGDIHHTGTIYTSGDVRGNYGSGQDVGLLTHEHDQGADGHGDAEQRTTKPVLGI